MKLRKMVIPIILTIVFVIGTVSCPSKTVQTNMHTGVEFYRNLQFSETPFDIEKGTRPLTADEATLTNNYKLTYDNSGRLLSVEFVRNSTLLGYSSMGGTAKIVYEYADNKPIVLIFIFRKSVTCSYKFRQRLQRSY